MAKQPTFHPRPSFRAVAVAVLTIGVVLGAPAFADSDSRPANDDFAAATRAPSGDFTAQADTESATLEASEPRPCGDIANTVWWTVTPDTAGPLSVRTNSNSTESILAIYEGASIETLRTVGCTASRGGQAEITVSTEKAHTYYIQSGGLARDAGRITMKMQPGAAASPTAGESELPAGWRQRTLTSTTQYVGTPDINMPLAVVDGAPNAQDARVYDLLVSTAWQKLQPVHVYTGGLMKNTSHLALLQLAPIGAQLHTTVMYRYDAAQPVCLVGYGSTCARLPFGDVRWATNGDGAKAALVVVAELTKDGVQLARQVVTVPLVGQAGAGLP